MAAAVVEAVEAAAEPAEEAAGAVGSGGIGLDPTRIKTMAIVLAFGSSLSKRERITASERERERKTCNYKDIV